MKAKLLCIAICSAVAQAYAESDAEVVLSTDYERRTNINRSATDPVDDDVWVYGGSASYQTQKQHGDVQLNYTVAHEKYLDETNSDRDRINGEAALNLYTSSRRLGVYAETRTAETSLDTLRAELPQNSNRVSSYQAGVQGRLRPSRRDAVDIRAGKIWVESENDLLNSESETAVVVWGHSLSARTSGGIQLVYLSTSPDAEEIADYGTQKAGIFWQRQLKTGSALLQVGAAKTDAVKPSGDQVGYVGEARLELESVTPRRSLQVTGGRELAGSGMGQGGNPNGGLRQTGNEFRLDIRDYFTADYRYQIAPQRLSWGLYGDYSHEKNQLADDLNEATRVGTDFTWQFKFGGELTLAADQISRKRGLEASAEQQDELNYSLQYRQEVARRVSVNCRYEVRQFESGIESTILGCGLDVAAF